MVAIRTLLLLTIALLFVVVALVLAARIRETKGSLRLAKASVILAALSTAGSFTSAAISALNYLDTTLVKVLYVPIDFFAMLVLAWLASFAIIATYAGPRRRLVLALVFIIALIPPLYLATSYNEASILGIIEPEVLIFQPPPFTQLLYAICGIPLGLIPIVVFARSIMAARRKGDANLTKRAATMFSAVFANEAVYLVYVFGTGVVELSALVLWIPAAFLLLYAVLKITSPV
ncbi:MAG: hypothetical protein WED04_12055 [Promethearchaeati archaeon SRVP18_Atabeyarchaeia-1]